MKIKNFFSGLGEKMVDNTEGIVIGGYITMIGVYVVYMIGLTYAVITGKFTPRV